MAGWHVWRALRDRPHVDLQWGAIDGADGVCIEVDGRRRVIVLDHRLGRRDRNAVLAHELVHDERGIFYRRSTPRALIEKEEAYVDAEVAARLVPLDELAAFIDRRSPDPVTLDEIAEEFDVPTHVAERASRLLDQRRRSPNHPSLRRITGPGQEAVQAALPSFGYE